MPARSSDGRCRRGTASAHRSLRRSTCRRSPRAAVPRGSGGDHRRRQAPLDLLLRLLGETGLRIAEASSLRRCDIEKNGKLWLVRVLPRGSFVPKTLHSARAVPISPELAEALLKLSDDPAGSLFECGTTYWYQHWRQLLIKAQRKAEVAPFTFHGLRRAVADRLRRTATPLDVYIAMMGHAAITGLRHYSTVSFDDIHEAQVKALTGMRRRETAKD